MDITIYEKISNPVEACLQLGQAFARSGLFGCEKTEAGVVLAFACMAERKSPLEIMRDYDIIGGKLRKKALTILANLRAKGGKHRWIKTGDDGQLAELELTFEGQTLVSSFSIEQAQRQGLVRPGSNWVKTPGNMLRARCMSNGVAMLCPEIVAGAIEDSGDDSQPLPEKPLFPVSDAPPQAPAATPAPAPVIDVPATVTPGAPAPQVPPVLAAQPAVNAPAPFVGVARPDGQLTAETQQALLNVFGDDGEVQNQILAWLVAKTWLQSGQHVGFLSLARAQRILDKPTAFLAAVAQSLLDKTACLVGVKAGAK